MGGPLPELPLLQGQADVRQARVPRAAVPARAAEDRARPLLPHMRGGEACQATISRSVTQHTYKSMTVMIFTI